MKLKIKCYKTQGFILIRAKDKVIIVLGNIKLEVLKLDVNLNLFSMNQWITWQTNHNKKSH